METTIGIMEKKMEATKGVLEGFYRDSGLQRGLYRDYMKGYVGII